MRTLQDVMMILKLPATPTVALVDLGSNSVRLMIVRINPNKSYTVQTRYKQMVRLGEGAFAAKKLGEAAMCRTIDALRNIAGICRGYEAGEIVALATAAVRDAGNGAEFVERAAAESGIVLEVVSGLEEARLIHLGVRTALPPFKGATVFIDIGGGSTELTVETPRSEPHYDSLKLGCVRLTNAFPELSAKGRVSPEQYGEVCAHVRNNSLRSVQKLQAYAIGERLRMVGSSGTIENLAEIFAQSPQAGRAQKKDGGGQDLSLSLKDLAELAKKLCGMTLEERAKIPGINPQRADVIVGGAAILQTLMEELDLREVVVSTRGLLDGMLQDYLERGRWGYLDGTTSAREQSALQLARSCNFDEKHARWMTRLALSLFDSAREIGLHRYGPQERELLYFAGLLHDIGLFLSFSNHHEHTRYMIENTELLGFHRSEIEIIATSTSLHRKWSPRKERKQNAQLSDEQWQLSATLGLFLRMAECLERSQQQTVANARLELRGKKIVLRVELLRDSPTELLSILDCKGVFKKCFGKNFEVEAGG